MKQKISFIALGILITIISIEFSLLIAGGIFLFLQERKNLHSLQQKDSVVILCLGESTTALGGDSAYSHQLEKILKNFDPSQKYSVINKGVPAVSTTNILKHLEGYLDRYKPDIVVAMMGINDEIYSQS